jgi:hypothetical protein
MDKKIIQKAGIFYTDEERHQIIQELLSTKCSKQEIWQKYTGEDREHGQLLRWMRHLGYNTNFRPRRRIIAPNSHPMPMKKKPEQSKNSEGDSFENLQLKKRITSLEAQLKDAEMKSIAFSTMIDIAEKEFNIPIRKKANTKPSKK